MDIEQRLDSILNEVKRCTDTSKQIQDLMVNKVTVAELDEILNRLCEHNNSSFVSRSEYKELKEQVITLGISLGQCLEAIETVNTGLKTELKTLKNDIEQDYLAVNRRSYTIESEVDHLHAILLEDIEAKYELLDDKLDDIKDEIPTDYLTTDDLYEYAGSDELTVLEDRVDELESRLEKIEP